MVSPVFNEQNFVILRISSEFYTAIPLGNFIYNPYVFHFQGPDWVGLKTMPSEDMNSNFESWVLVIYTGGTIGMVENDAGGKFNIDNQLRDNKLTGTLYLLGSKC